MQKQPEPANAAWLTFFRVIRKAALALNTQEDEALAASSQDVEASK